MCEKEKKSSLNENVRWFLEGNNTHREDKKACYHKCWIFTQKWNKRHNIKKVNQQHKIKNWKIENQIFKKKRRCKLRKDGKMKWNEKTPDCQTEEINRNK